MIECARFTRALEAAGLWSRSSAFGQDSLGVYPVQDTQQSSLGVRNQDAAHSPLSHALADLPKRGVRSDRRRALFHDGFDGGPRVSLEPLTSETAENDAMIISNDAHVLVRVLRFVPCVAETVGQAAGRDVPLSDISGARLPRRSAFGRKAAGSPVRLAGSIIEHLSEA